MTSEICLSCIIRHPEHNKIKIDMVESGEAFEGVFEFHVQETLKDLSQNGKLTVLNPKQEAAMSVQSVNTDVLAIDLSNTGWRLHGSHCYLHIASQICFKVSEYTE